MRHDCILVAMKRKPVREDQMFFFWKVIEGALRGDESKVRAYAEHLHSRFEAEGDLAHAGRLRRILDGRGSHEGMALQKASSAGQTGASKLPVDAESRLPVADEERWPAGSIRIVVNEEARALIDRFLRHFKAADRLLSNGIAVSPSMLLHGPPGTGKTQIARFIAAELGLPLVVSRSDALISSYLGSTAKNVRVLFEHAASRPCVLFLDEFDAIAKMRDDGREVGELKRVVIGLLQNIDAIGRDHLLIAATNHPHLLDPAIWRRFAHHISLGLPAQTERAELLRMFLDDRVAPDVTEVLAMAGEGLSGAQLRDVCEDGLREAVINSDDVNVLHMIDMILLAKGVERPSGLTSAQKIRLIHAADSRGVTQQTLARIFNLSQSQISRSLRKVE
jgi:hypothetical protein